jgi:hypothetical protein
MRVFEFTSAYDPATFYYSAEDDRINTRRLGDTRKVKLTLRDVNRLKQKRRAVEHEKAQRLELVRFMYLDRGEPGDGGLPVLF